MKINDRLHEKCGVFGVSMIREDAAGLTYNGLLSLQHRGQEGAGIAVVSGSKILSCRNTGLVSEVLNTRELDRLAGSLIAVGHTRYGTTGGSTIENVGPFVTEYLTGRVATAHNGNVTNAREIRSQLKRYGLDFNATSDSEVISALIAYFTTLESDIIRGVIRAGRKLQGAFSLVVASSENKLIALRDPDGYRPLCLGQNSSGIAVASESCALEANGFSFVRDIQPGELVVMEKGKITYQKIELVHRQKNSGLCIFEFIYFARPDSYIDGLSVYQARYNMGSVLACEHPADADMVCGVPDSGLEAALGYSSQSGIPLAPGFVKNRYIGRSFIYPTQALRDHAVRLKLNPLAAAIQGKRIVLIDDSIVRGTTSERIVRSLKNAGAKAVHMRVSSPPFRFPCHYGTDIDSRENLIANKMSLNEISKQIGAESLGYISVEGLKKACQGCALPFCTQCFTGDFLQKETRKNNGEVW